MQLGLSHKLSCKTKNNVVRDDLEQLIAKKKERIVFHFYVIADFKKEINMEYK